MSEFSWNWVCEVGDGTPVNQGMLSALTAAVGNVKPTDSGVVYWTETNAGSLQDLVGISNAVDGLLEPTESGGVVTVDTGMAIVTGWMYVSDVATAFDIDGNAGAASATDIIALRRDVTAGTVRLVRLSGAAGATATLTQTSATWEIPICEVELDAGGLFSALVDVRQAASDSQVIARVSSSTSTIDTVDSVVIPPLWNHLEIRGSLAVFSGSKTFGLQFNGDQTANNYEYTTWNTGAFAKSNVASDRIVLMPISSAAGIYTLTINNYSRRNYGFFPMGINFMGSVADRLVGGVPFAGDQYFTNGMYSDGNYDPVSILDFIYGSSTNSQTHTFSVIGYK